MKHLLSREGVEIVTQLSWSRVLLAFDFDGTLAPIVANRGDARMRRETSRLFARACERYPSVVISGRSRKDVAGRLGDARPARVVGNHGIEPTPRMSACVRDIATVRPRLLQALAHELGVEIEDKRYSLAIHYRRSRSKRIALARIRAAVAGLTPAMRMTAGKLVVNELPAHAPDKGDALIESRLRTNTDTAIYVGDDVTDEDVFRLDQPGRLVTVRVGRSVRSLASYYLRDQHEMDALLKLLIDLRKGPLNHEARRSPRPLESR